MRHLTNNTFTIYEIFHDNFISTKLAWMSRWFALVILMCWPPVTIKLLLSIWLGSNKAIYSLHCLFFDYLYITYVQFMLIQTECILAEDVAHTTKTVLAYNNTCLFYTSMMLAKAHNCLQGMTEKPLGLLSDSLSNDRVTQSLNRCKHRAIWLWLELAKRRFTSYQVFNCRQP